MANLDDLASPHPRIKGWRCSPTSIASSMCNTLSFIPSPCQKGKKNPPFTEEGCNEFGCRLGAIREVKMYSFPPLPGQHSGSSWTDYCRCRICRLVYGWGWKNRLVMDWLAYSIDFGFRPLCFTSHEARGASSKTSFSKPTKICKTTFFLVNVLPVLEAWSCPVAWIPQVHVQWGRSCKP